jgi:hypothetical protein
MNNLIFAIEKMSKGDVGKEGEMDEGRGREEYGGKDEGKEMFNLKYNIESYMF